jgi:predicted nucleotidyltransferase
MLQNITEIDRKILSMFVRDYSSSYTIRKMTQLLGINYSHAFHRVNELVKMQILRNEKRGHANYITLNLADLGAVRLVCSAEESKKYNNPLLDVLIKEIIALDPFACIGLFGSRVSGRAVKGSDWDVFVIAAKRKEIERMLSRLSYMKDIQVQVFDEAEFMDSLLSPEETVVRHIVKNKQIIYNPHPFYNLVKRWEKIRYVPSG